MPVTPPTYVSRASLWQDGAAGLFRDARASKVGDLVTVKISINDQASFNNSTNVSRAANLEMNLTNTANLTWKGI